VWAETVDDVLGAVLSEAAAGAATAAAS
jgi:hypothetical protein